MSKCKKCGWHFPENEIITRGKRKGVCKWCRYNEDREKSLKEKVKRLGR